MENEIVLSALKTKWNIDFAHSDIGFKVKHLMISHVSGSFKEFNASIYTTGEDFMSSEIDLFINAESIDTGNETRDEHLKSEEFLDVINHKEIIFIGDTYEKVDEADRFELYGKLNIKGITKKIKLNIEFGGIINDPWGNKKAGFTIRGIINRKDWGLTWNTTLETGGVMVSDEIKIDCALQLIKQA